jgi:hypothetical protein
MLSAREEKVAVWFHTFRKNSSTTASASIDPLEPLALLLTTMMMSLRMSSGLGCALVLLLSGFAMGDNEDPDRAVGPQQVLAEEAARSQPHERSLKGDGPKKKQGKASTTTASGRKFNWWDYEVGSVRKKSSTSDCQTNRRQRQLKGVKGSKAISTCAPTFEPSLEPTLEPTVSPAPSTSPEPTLSPTVSRAPTVEPTLGPKSKKGKKGAAAGGGKSLKGKKGKKGGASKTSSPTASPSLFDDDDDSYYSAEPTAGPAGTKTPTKVPTKATTSAPATKSPTKAPTQAPTKAPTAAPV